MNTGSVGESLKRKLGPLPVWAWALIGGAALYWYRNRRAGQQVPVAQQTSTQTSTPQSPVVFQPGESVYDPNTGLLAGGQFSGSGMNGSLLGLIGALLAAEVRNRNHPRNAPHHHKPPKHRHHHRIGRTQHHTGRHGMHNPGRKVIKTNKGLRIAPPHRKHAVEIGNNKPGGPR